MKTVDVVLSRRAATQHGLVQRRQALGLGMTQRQLQARVAAGLLVPVHRGVYRLRGATSSPEQPVMAACLAAGAGALASHRSAAWLWGLRGIDSGRPELMVPGARLPVLTGVTIHRTDTLDPVDVTRRRGIPVTTPARTLIDLGAVVEPEVVESALEDALLRGLVAFTWLRGSLERLGGPGRNGAGVLRRLLEERDPATAPTQSALEDLVYRVLRRGGIPEPVRQFKVGGVLLDFAWPPWRVGLEADSRIWHGGRLDVQRNSDKANVLLAHGWRVLHATWADARYRAGHVVAAVARELALACPA